jgi:hypothetical protein
MFLLGFLSGSDLVDHLLLSLWVPVVMGMGNVKCEWEIQCKLFLQSHTSLQNAYSCCSNHSVPIMRYSWCLSEVSDTAWQKVGWYWLATCK